MNIIISKSIPENENSYSIEAGKHDGKKHFDHHGSFSGNPAVCVQNIPEIDDKDNANIYISHVDADTLKGVAKLLGINFAPDINWDIVGDIDTNGPEYVPNTEEGKKARAFMLGINQVARTVPREGDVTGPVMDMLVKNANEYIEIGNKIMEEGKSSTMSYIEKLDKDNKVALLNIPADAKVGADAGLLYAMGYSIVVAYNGKFKSISIYGSKKLSPSPIKDLRREWAGIKFDGHALACGSPRGVEFTFKDAENVFNDIVRYLKEGGNERQ